MLLLRLAFAPPPPLPPRLDAARKTGQVPRKGLRACFCRILAEWGSLTSRRREKITMGGLLEIILASWGLCRAPGAATKNGPGEEFKSSRGPLLLLLLPFEGFRRTSMDYGLKVIGGVRRITEVSGRFRRFPGGLRILKGL